MSSLIFSNGVQRSLGKEFIELLGRGASWIVKLKTNKEENKKTCVDTRTIIGEGISSMSFFNTAISRYESMKSLHVATCKTLVNSGPTANDIPLEPDSKEPELLILINVESHFLEKS